MGQDPGSPGKDSKQKFYHEPVMLKEVLASLKPKPGGIYVDCTVGAGGHSLLILRLTSPDGFLVGLDRDPYAIECANQNLSDYKHRLALVRENFFHLPKVLKGLGITTIDGVLYDLGVSSIQLEAAERGFSYKLDGPLDMRMNPEDPANARELINNLSEAELADIFWSYGEERWAKRIASFIVHERQHCLIETTCHLADVVKRAIPAYARRRGPHPAKRAFQALRIAVNRELDILKQSLKDAVSFLKIGGRICVITFHSLEDRIVKVAFKEMATSCICPPDFPVCVCSGRSQLRIATPSFYTPSQEEVEYNPRSRSAKLRVAEKIN